MNDPKNISPPSKPDIAYFHEEVDRKVLEEGMVVRSAPWEVEIGGETRWWYDVKFPVKLKNAWWADTNDTFYGSPNGITARAGVSDSSWLGQQTQLAVRYLATPNLLITSYLTRFFAGDMIQDAGGSDRDYFHIGIHYLF